MSSHPSLSEVVRALDDVDPHDTAEVLALLWDGLCRSRLIGLFLAAQDQRRARLQANAEAVEHAIAVALRGSSALAGRALELPGPGSGGEPRERGDAADALLALFADTAQRVALSASAHAEQWTDHRACANASTLATELREAWSGNRPSYRHVPARKR
ncbi:hypothetical protein [Umezawaea beigongshangensis]|uniref:hypothetical protein n=1 Tax=Umezawaea beigongshangensis TaxID=2780383 RepID=UPI0018F22202|nr:hypothetical protein [Umezawaea beigongshangensis]